MQEKTIETKQCKHCNTSFEITNKDLEFYEKISPVFETPPNLPLSGEELEQFVASSPLTRGELRGVLDGVEKELRGVLNLGNGKVKYSVPTPNLCPDCRQQRRLSFRNDRSLYKRKCDFSAKEIISIYSPDKPYKVYDREIWISDKWDPLDYGKDFDFSRSFFKQFNELLKVVPRQNLFLDNTCENSNFSNQLTNCKDCYLCFSGSTSEKCFYCNRVNFCENCFDCLLIKNSKECYECISSFNCYDCKYSQSIIDCQNSSFLYNCSGCEYCFGCVNLVNKKYHIFNKQYREEEYLKEIKKYGSVEETKIYFNDFLKTFPNKYANINNVENSSGDNISNVKNSSYIFDGTNIEDSKYCYFFDDSSDCMDINYSCDNTTLHYEVSTGGINSTKVIFSIDVWPEVNNLMYCDSCSSGSNNLFGCVGLRNKSYCILNKQYTKDEYEKLVPKIIEHMMKPLPPSLRGIEGESEWGEFFPSSISPFGYNETVAQEYFPKTKSEVLGCHSELVSESTKECIIDPEINSGGQLLHGGTFNWSTYNQPFPKVEKIIPANKIPENISDIPDDILNWAIECEVTKKPFKIIKQELEFYRKHNFPIPKRHPDQRHLDRMKQRNPRRLFDRKCNKCGIEIKTTYSPDRKEIVYCEKCYNGEVY